MKLSSKEGRKYTYTVTVFIAACVYFAIGKLTGAEWIQCVVILAGIFGVTNSIEKFAGGKNE